MPISLSALRSGAAALGVGGGGARGSRIVMRGGRAFKLVPAGARIQHRRRFHGARKSHMDKLIEIALIANLISGTHK